MKINGFIWLDQFVEKLEAKHGVLPEEVEEVFANHPRFSFAESGTVEGENLYRALGQTDSGRYLTVLFIFKQTGQALIISARDMDRKERKQYGKK